MQFITKNHEVTGKDKSIIDLRLEDVPNLMAGKLLWPDGSAFSTDTFNGVQDAVKIGRGQSWDGNLTWGEMLTMLKEGWAEGAERALRLADKIDRKDKKACDAINIRRKRVRSDQGDYLNMEQVSHARLDQAWTTSKRNRVSKSRRISLIVSWGGNAGRTMEELFWTGAVALVLTDHWQKAGFRVAIKAATAQSFDGHDNAVVLDVKKHGDPVNPGFLAAVLCHPAPFRKIGFLGIPCASKKKCNSGLGRHASPSDIDIQKSRFVDPQSVVLDSVYSESSAIEALKEHFTFMID